MQWPSFAATPTPFFLPKLASGFHDCECNERATLYLDSLMSTITTTSNSTIISYSLFCYHPRLYDSLTIHFYMHQLREVTNSITPSFPYIYLPTRHPLYYHLFSYPLYFKLYLLLFIPFLFPYIYRPIFFLILSLSKSFFLASLLRCHSKSLSTLVKYHFSYDFPRDVVV